jgi:hypothetical protein
MRKFTKSSSGSSLLILYWHFLYSNYIYLSYKINLRSSSEEESSSHACLDGKSSLPNNFSNTDYHVNACHLLGPYKVFVTGRIVSGLYLPEIEAPNSDIILVVQLKNDN